MEQEDTRACSEGISVCDVDAAHEALYKLQVVRQVIVNTDETPWIDGVISGMALVMGEALEALEGFVDAVWSA